VAIQRGQVYIGNSPKLCNIDQVNWDLLTLSRGENHVTMVSKNCSTPVCSGCSSSHCWSNRYCQRSLNDNVADYSMWVENKVLVKQDGALEFVLPISLNLYHRSKIETCHEDCLGGCTKPVSAADCSVCRGLSDAGVCVKSCPKDKW